MLRAVEGEKEWEIRENKRHTDEKTQCTGMRRRRIAPAGERETSTMHDEYRETSTMHDEYRETSTMCDVHRGRSVICEEK